MSTGETLYPSWKAVGIEMPPDARLDLEYAPRSVASKFDRQSAFWDLLMRAAGYPRAYRDLFARLGSADLLPTGRHRVLDGGAGTGTLALAYARHAPGAEICAADVSRRMLARAARHFDRAGVHGTTTCSDVTRLPFPDGHFDLVISAHCLDHTPDPPAALSEMSRVLRRGGSLVFVTGRPGPLDSVARCIWGYRNIETPDVLAWMWNSGVEPIGALHFGSRHRLAHWLSEAAIGRKRARR